MLGETSMRAYAFKVVAGEEGMKEGTIYAPSMAVARNSLLDQFDRLLSIEPVKREKATKIRYAPALFTRELSTLLRTGIAINRALDLLAEQAEDLDFQVALLDVNLKVTGGSPLSRALEEHPRFFSPLYVSMCRVGEMRGDLPRVLMGLAEHQEMEESMKRRLTQAMTYPAVVLAITAVLTLFLFNFVLPYFVDVFDQMNIKLPIYSQVLILAVKVMNNPITAAFLAFIIAAGIYYFRCWLDTPEGRHKVDQLKLTIPLVRDLFQRVILARFAKTLALLLSGGVYTDVALDLSSYVVQNSLYEKMLFKGQQFIREGKGTLSQFFRKEGADLIPKTFVEFVVAGEETGHLTEMLERIAALYDQDVEYATKSFLAAVEPMLVFVTGSIVGFIVLAIFMPLYSFMGTMS
jgi:type IV pilus assembly protein PilC